MTGPRTTAPGWLLLPLAALAALAFGFGSPPGVGHRAGLAAGEPVTVIDGDTLQIGGRVVDLFGIDAPELGQLCRRGDGRRVWECGVTAAEALRKLIALNQGQITCAPWEGGGAGAAPFVCRARHEDLGEVMLREGYAVAAAHGPPSYGEHQRAARAAGLGVWSGHFVEPSRWREGDRLPPRPGLPIEGCNVKGAVDAVNGRVYYVPTDAAYRDVTLDLSTDERIFCSDEEARAAGWRRPGEAVTTAPQSTTTTTPARPDS